MLLNELLEVVGPVVHPLINGGDCMYGQVLSASTVVTGVAGVALLPNTGNTRVLFVVATTMLVVGLVAFAASSLMAMKRRSNDA
jgi:hypothetical protein